MIGLDSFLITACLKIEYESTVSRSVEQEKLAASEESGGSECSSGKLSVKYLSCAESKSVLYISANLRYLEV